MQKSIPQEPAKLMNLKLDYKKTDDPTKRSYVYYQPKEHNENVIEIFNNLTDEAAVYDEKLMMRNSAQNNPAQNLILPLIANCNTREKNDLDHSVQIKLKKIKKIKKKINQTLNSNEIQFPKDYYEENNSLKNMNHYSKIGEQTEHPSKVFIPKRIIPVKKAAKNNVKFNINLNLINNDIFSDEKSNDPVLRGDKKVSNSFLKSLGNLVKYKQHIANMVNQRNQQIQYNIHYYNQLRRQNQNEKIKVLHNINNYTNNPNPYSYENEEENNEMSIERYFEDYYTNDTPLPSIPNIDTNNYNLDSKIIPKKQKNSMLKKTLVKKNLVPSPFPVKSDIKNSYLASSISNNPDLIKNKLLNDQVKIEQKNEVSDIIRILKNNNSEVYKKLINKYGF